MKTNSGGTLVLPGNSALERSSVILPITGPGSEFSFRELFECRCSLETIIRTEAEQSD